MDSCASDIYLVVTLIWGKIWYSCYVTFGWLKGQILYFDFNITDVRLYVIEFVHISMMMRLDVTGCVMMLYGYFGFRYMLWFSTIDALLLCCSVYHICMLMLFWDDSRSMMISSYRVNWTYVLIMLWDEPYAMVIYFILVSLRSLRTWVM